MRQALGIDLGGTNVRCARVSATGELLAQQSQPTAKGAAAVLAQIDDLITELDGPEVAAIGIGVPSRVHAKTAEVYPGGFVDLSGPPLAKRLSRTNARPVVTENDATMALVAEARIGAARGFANVVLLTIGTGVGGAVMLNGKVAHGRATAGQLGHITVAFEGETCVCGRPGCLETLSSGTALGRHIREAGLPADTKAEDLLTRTDATSRAVMARWLQPLRAGIDSLVATLDPDLIVLGGGLGHAAAAGLARFPAPSSWFQSTIVPATLGPGSGVVGAALAALEAEA